MKKVIGYVLLLFILGVAQAQTTPSTKVTVGDEIEVFSKLIRIGMVEVPSGGVVQVNHDPRKTLRLSKFSADLKLVKVVDIDISYIQRGYQSIGLEMVGGNCYWFYGTYEKDARLYVQKIDLEKLALDGEPQTIIQITSGEVIRTFFNWDMQVSTDNNKILVTFGLFYGSKDYRDENKPYQMGVYMFDGNMKKVWGAEKPLPFTQSELQKFQFIAGEDGIAYLVALLTKEISSDDKIENAVTIYKMDKESVWTKLSSVDIGHNILGFPFIAKCDKQGSFYACGLYRVQEKLSSPLEWDGVWVTKFLKEEAGNFQGVNSVYEFPIEILKKYEKDSRKEVIDEFVNKDGIDPGFPHLSLQDLVIGEDGSIAVASSQWYTNATDGKITSEVGLNDVLVVFDSNCQFKWVQKIPKNQESRIYYFDHGLRTKLVFANGSFYCLYMDTEENMGEWPDEKPKKYLLGAKGQLVVVKIDAGGRLSKTSALDAKQIGAVIIPNKFSLQSDGSLVLFTNGSKKSFPLRVNIK